MIEALSALRRYDTMLARDPDGVLLPRDAWREISLRLETAAETADSATVERCYAACAEGWARYARGPRSRPDAARAAAVARRARSTEALPFGGGEGAAS